MSTEGGQPGCAADPASPSELDTRGKLQDTPAEEPRTEDPSDAAQGGSSECTEKSDPSHVGSSVPLCNGLTWKMWKQDKEGATPKALCSCQTRQSLHDCLDQFKLTTLTSSAGNCSVSESSREPRLLMFKAGAEVPPPPRSQVSKGGHCEWHGIPQQDAGAVWKKMMVAVVEQGVASDDAHLIRGFSIQPTAQRPPRPDSDCSTEIPNQTVSFSIHLTFEAKPSAGLLQKLQKLVVGATQFTFVEPHVTTKAQSKGPSQTWTTTDAHKHTLAPGPKNYLRRHANQEERRWKQKEADDEEKKSPQNVEQKMLDYNQEKKDFKRERVGRGTSPETLKGYQKQMALVKKTASANSDVPQRGQPKGGKPTDTKAIRTPSGQPSKANKGGEKEKKKWRDASTLVPAAPPPKPEKDREPIKEPMQAQPVTPPSQKTSHSHFHPHPHSQPVPTNKHHQQGLRPTPVQAKKTSMVYGQRSSPLPAAAAAIRRRSPHSLPPPANKTTKTRQTSRSNNSSIVARTPKRQTTAGRANTSHHSSSFSSTPGGSSSAGSMVNISSINNESGILTDSPQPGSHQRQQQQQRTPPHQIRHSGANDNMSKTPSHSSDTPPRSAAVSVDLNQPLVGGSRQLQLQRAPHSGGRSGGSGNLVNTTTTPIQPYFYGGTSNIVSPFYGYGQQQQQLQPHKQQNNIFATNTRNNKNAYDTLLHEYSEQQQEIVDYYCEDDDEEEYILEDDCNENYEHDDLLFDAHQQHQHQEHNPYYNLTEYPNSEYQHAYEFAEQHPAMVLSEEDQYFMFEPQQQQQQHVLCGFLTNQHQHHTEDYLEMYPQDNFSNKSRTHFKPSSSNPRFMDDQSMEFQQQQQAPLYEPQYETNDLEYAKRHPSGHRGGFKSNNKKWPPTSPTRAVPNHHNVSPTYSKYQRDVDAALFQYYY